MITPESVNEVLRMLDEVVRNRRGTSLFQNGKPTNICLLWKSEIEKTGDAEIATKAIAALYSELPFDVLPTPQAYREVVQRIRRDRRPIEPVAQEKKTKLAFWVKRWAAARFLYEHFGRERDMRPFPEQADYIDPTKERMPPDEWVEEAKKLSDADVWAAVGR